MVDGRDGAQAAAQADAAGSPRDAVAGPRQRRGHLDRVVGDGRHLDRPEAELLGHGHRVPFGDLDLAGALRARPGGRGEGVWASAGSDGKAWDRSEGSSEGGPVRRIRGARSAGGEHDGRGEGHSGCPGTHHGHHAIAPLAVVHRGSQHMIGARQRLGSRAAYAAAVAAPGAMRARRPPAATRWPQARPPGRTAARAARPSRARTSPRSCRARRPPARPGPPPGGAG